MSSTSDFAAFVAVIEDLSTRLREVNKILSEINAWHASRSLEMRDEMSSSPGSDSDSDFDSDSGFGPESVSGSVSGSVSVGVCVGGW